MQNSSKHPSRWNWSNVKNRKAISNLAVFTLILIFCVPLIINISYLHGYRTSVPPNTAFLAGDLLIFFGAILSAAGSFTVGYISYSLNKKVLALTEADNERNKYATVILEARTHLTKEWEAYLEGYNDVDKQAHDKGFEIIDNICFRLHNIGPAVLTYVKIIHLNEESNEKVELVHLCTLAPNTSKDIKTPWLKGMSFVKLRLEFISSYGKSTFALCHVVPGGHDFEKYETITDYEIVESLNA